jgi:hypothetical protein
VVVKDASSCARPSGYNLAPPMRLPDCAGSVAEVRDGPPANAVAVVLVNAKSRKAHSGQLPAASTALTTFAGVAVVSETAEAALRGGNCRNHFMGLSVRFQGARAPPYRRRGRGNTSSRLRARRRGNLAVAHGPPEGFSGEPRAGSFDFRSALTA